MKKVAILMPVLMLLLLGSGCFQILTKIGIEPNKIDTSNVITIIGSTTTLCWDPPISSPNVVVSYELQWRKQDASSWNIMATGIPADNAPCYTVSRNTLPQNSSDFVFAVSSVAQDGQKSTLHASIDADAKPMPWVVRWPGLGQ